MNRNSLSQHYRELSAQERMSLIDAADSRDDQKEVHKLLQSAPRMSIKILDFFGRADAFQQTSWVILLQLLEAAGVIWCLAPELGDRSRDDVRAIWWQDCYTYLAVRAGWRKFCNDIKVNETKIFSSQMLRLTDQLTEDLSLEHVATLLGGVDTDGGQLPTVEQIAKDIRSIYEELASHWEFPG